MRHLSALGKGNCATQRAWRIQTVSADTGGAPHEAGPETKSSFWVNLIGRGYPAPKKMFRWCTVRLKIEPSNRFIRDMVRENGEALLVLGTRNAESQRRALAIDQRRVRERLTPNANLPDSLVYTPVEDWSNAAITGGWTGGCSCFMTAPCPAHIPKNGANIGCGGCSKCSAKCGRWGRRKWPS